MKEDMHGKSGNVRGSGEPLAGAEGIIREYDMRSEYPELVGIIRELQGKKYSCQVDEQNIATVRDEKDAIVYVGPIQELVTVQLMISEEGSTRSEVQA